MRMFLPIKGPGGRYLTTREKIALLILGLTLVLCALTLLAGDGAYAIDGNRNPVSAFVAFLCRTFGGGIVALYALVLVWSGLIYFKGERAVDMRPLAGRMFAALCVTLGISGVLGIAHLETAGSLGLTVGAAIGNTFGATLGFPILIVLMLLGVHLAGQGAWSAMREPVRASATATATGGLGFGLKDAPQGRFAHEPPLPDDGDPTADERTLAITQAMEEIERSKGVTIVDVDPETVDERSSIGEDVDAVADYDDDTEEAEIRRGVAAVEEVLAAGSQAPVEDAEETAEEEEDDDDEEMTTRHGFVPVPPSTTAVPHEDECVEAVFRGDVEEEEEVAEEEEDEAAYASYDDEEEEDDEEEAYAGEEGEYDDEEAYDDEEYDEEEDESEEAYAEEEEDEDVDDEEEEASYLDEESAEAEYEEDDLDEDEDDAIEAEADDDEEAIATAEEEIDDEPVAAEAEEAEAEEVADDEETAEAEYADDEEESYESIVAGQADGAGTDDDEAEDDDADPYAQGGLLRRLRQAAGTADASDDDDRPYTAFDWRGRPLD